MHDCVHNTCGYKSLLPCVWLRAVLQTPTFPACLLEFLSLKATVQNAVSLSCTGIAGSVWGSRSSLVILSSLCTVVCLSAEPVMTQTRNADAVWHFIPPGRVRLSAACVCVWMQTWREAGDWVYVHCVLKYGESRSRLKEDFWQAWCQKWGREGIISV